MAEIRGCKHNIFFFASLKQRVAQKRINKLINSARVVTQGAQLEEEITDYYKLLLGTCVTSLPMIDPMVIRDGAL